MIRDKLRDDRPRSLETLQRHFFVAALQRNVLVFFILSLYFQLLSQVFQKIVQELGKTTCKSINSTLRVAERRVGVFCKRKTRPDHVPNHRTQSSVDHILQISVPFERFSGSIWFVRMDFFNGYVRYITNHTLPVKFSNGAEICSTYNHSPSVSTAMANHV